MTPGGDAFAKLAERLPEWGRLFSAESYARFLDLVRAELGARAEPFELHDDYARIANASAFGSGPSAAAPGPPDSWDLPLLPLAQACPGLDAGCIREQIQRRFDEEKLGRELDALRGDFEKARPLLKLRVQRGPSAISAPIAGELHASLVLDLPSFVTPVRVADLAGWEKPADELVALALENVKAQEQVELRPMEIGGARIFAVSGKSLFVATLGLAAEDLLGPSAGDMMQAPTAPHRVPSALDLGALVAMPSAHIVLLHAIADRRSLRALEAMAAGSLQAFEGGPSPLSPDLLWKRGDRFLALPVRREGGEVKCEIPREFDEQVGSKLG